MMAIAVRTVKVVDGAVTFHIMTEEGPQSYALKAGVVVIVPQRASHRFRGAGGGEPDDHPTAADPASDIRDRRSAHTRIAGYRHSRELRGSRGNCYGVAALDFPFRGMTS
jgi:hypothetical protein